MSIHRKTRKEKRKQKQIVVILILSMFLLISAGYAAFNTNLSLKAKGHIKGDPINDYITDELFLFYDAKENTIDGQSKPTDTWYNKAQDLSNNAFQGNATMYNFSESDWQDDGLYFNGSTPYIDTGVSQVEFGQNITFDFIANVYNKEPGDYYGIYGYHISDEATYWNGMASQDTYSSSIPGRNKMYFYYYTVSNEKANSLVYCSIDFNLIINKKIKYTVVMEGGVGMKLYINGKLYSTASNNFNIQPYVNSNFVIGDSFDGGNRNYKIIKVLFTTLKFIEKLFQMKRS